MGAQRQPKRSQSRHDAHGLRCHDVWERRVNLQTVSAGNVDVFILSSTGKMSLRGSKLVQTEVGSDQ